MNTFNESEMQQIHAYMQERYCRADPSDYIQTEEAIESIYEELGCKHPEILWVKSPAAAEYLYGVGSGHIPSWFYAKHYYPELHTFDPDIPQTFWKGVSCHLDLPLARALLSKASNDYRSRSTLSEYLEAKLSTTILGEIRSLILYEEEQRTPDVYTWDMGWLHMEDIFELSKLHMPWTGLLSMSNEAAIPSQTFLDIALACEELDIELPERGLLNKPFFRAIKCVSENSAVWYPWESVVLIIEKPESVLQQHGVLHAEDRPAVTWRDGIRSWYLNGVHVPRWLVETPAEEIDPRSVLKEQNAEIRREIIRKAGIEAILSGLNAKCIDQKGDYELLLLDMETPDSELKEEDEAYGILHGDEDARYSRHEYGDYGPVRSVVEIRYRPYLKMINPSTGDTHIEGVHPACRTVRAALAWRNGTGERPVVLT